MTKSMVNRTLHWKVQKTSYCTFMTYPALGSSLPQNPNAAFSFTFENEGSDLFYTFLMLLNLTSAVSLAARFSPEISNEA